mgnify:FL=1
MRTILSAITQRILIVISTGRVTCPIVNLGRRGAVRTARTRFCKTCAECEYSRADRVPVAETWLESLVQTAHKVAHDNEHESASHFPTGVALHWIVFRARPRVLCPALGLGPGAPGNFDGSKNGDDDDNDVHLLGARHRGSFLVRELNAASVLNPRAAPLS